MAAYPECLQSNFRAMLRVNNSLIRRVQPGLATHYRKMTEVSQ